nr:DNA adenine methylase [uncultured Roseibium sp.]
MLKNNLEHGHYAEPFAGGAGLALALLFNGVVSEIHLNDIDRGISSLWNCILDHTDELLELLRETPVTIEEWHRQRDKNARADASEIEAAFSTLFLNRTNRSGIIKGAGVIGGLHQNGNYLLDCRFNKEELARRIRRIKRYRSRIHFSSRDALEFLDIIDQELPERALVCADPPYFVKGSNLYTSFYRSEDHSKLAEQILGLTSPWVTTYDNCEEISCLYRSHRQYEFSVQYSVQTKRKAAELLIASKGLRIPSSLRKRQRSVSKRRSMNMESA